MITPEQENLLDELSIIFLRKLRDTFPSEDWEATFTDKLEVVIPPIDDRIGEIHIWLDGDEVTVGIGQLFHTHFETYLDDSLSKTEANEQAVLKTIEFIRDVLADKYVIEICYKGNNPTRARVFPLGEEGLESWTIPIGGITEILRILFSPKKKIARYVWSGKEIDKL
jgi:hypothetical protein